MNTISLASSLSVSVRIYRAMLVMYPKKFRDHYETQMVQVFRDSLRDAYRNNGMSGVIDLWLHTCADLLVTALNERFMERSQFMFSPKVILWGGLASIFCGLFWMFAGVAPSSRASTSVSDLVVGLAGVAPSSRASISVLALVLGLGGLVGLYSRQAGQGGKLGLAGFALGITGTGLALAALLGISGSSANLEIDPVGAAPAVLISSLGMVILGVGLVVLGVTCLRSKTPYRWRGLPLCLGLLSTMFGMIVWLVVYMPLSQGHVPWTPPNTYRIDMLLTAVYLLVGLGWMGLGSLLATEANAQVAQPPPAAA